MDEHEQGRPLSALVGISTVIVVNRAMKIKSRPKP